MAVEIAGVPAWAVTTADAITRATRSASITKDARNWKLLTGGGVPDDWPLLTWVLPQNMLTSSGQDHRRLREVVAGVFTGGRITAMTAAVEEITSDLVAGLTSRDGFQSGGVDLRRHLALPLPLQVIGQLLGVPAADRADLQTLCDKAFATSGVDGAAAYRELRAAFGELYKTARNRPPGDDVTSALARREFEDALSETEAVDTLMLLLGAGYETTVNLICNAVRAMLAHPEQRAQVQLIDVDGDGGGLWPQVVDETLRWAPPISIMPMRYTSAPTTLGDGLTVPEGEAVLLAYGAAGRDPAVHSPDPDRFNAFRTTRRTHLAFGDGPHFCPGARLAQLEARTALKFLFSSLPDLHLAVDDKNLEPLPGCIANGPAQLPVHYGPNRTSGRR